MASNSSLEPQGGSPVRSYQRDDILTSDMMMVADLGPAHTAEKFLGPIGANSCSMIRRIALLSVCERIAKGGKMEN
jgi:hypothetical protein